MAAGASWRKVRAPQGRMLDNVQARKRDRQCNRKQTARFGRKLEQGKGEMAR